MDNPLISIIIPVYNAEKYLHQCLDSVVAQTYTNWECLLIDDGSKDSSGAICDEYAEKDSRFRVFHKENGGVSSARNLGIKEASGEWIYFCDSDDYIYPQGLEIMMSYTNNDIDLVMAGHERVDASGKVLDKVPKLQNELIDRKTAVARMYVFPNFDYEGYLWDKLFRRSCIIENKIEFDPKISFKEDSLFCVQFICASKKKVFYTTKIIYRYILNETSAMAKTRAGGYNPKHWTSLNAHLIQIDVLRKTYPNHEILPVAEDRMFGNLMYNRNLMVSNNCFDRQLFNEYKDKVLSHMTQPMKSRCLIRYTLIGRAINKILRHFHLQTI